MNHFKCAFILVLLFSLFISCENQIIQNDLNHEHSEFCNHSEDDNQVIKYEVIKHSNNIQIFDCDGNEVSEGSDFNLIKRIIEDNGEHYDIGISYNFEIIPDDENHRVVHQNGEHRYVIVNRWCGFCGVYEIEDAWGNINDHLCYLWYYVYECECGASGGIMKSHKIDH